MQQFCIFTKNIIEHLDFNNKSNKIFIFIIKNSNFSNNNIIFFSEFLSKSEIDKANNFYTKNLTESYIIAHSILRNILGQFAKILPQQVEFVHNEYGKPFLKDSNIQFNISHSNNIISYIVALNYKVGIDVELYKNQFNYKEFSDLVFTPSETKIFSCVSLKEEIKTKLFYNLWVKKESLVKATGQGLIYPINTIEAIFLSYGDKIVINQTEWLCFPLKIAKNYAGAIAIENKFNQTNQIMYLEFNNKTHIFDNIKLLYKI